MYNKKLMTSIVLIVALLAVSTLIVWQLTKQEEELQQPESIQKLLEEARNKTKTVDTVAFEQAEITAGYDPLEFSINGQLFDRLGRDRRPKGNFEEVYQADDALYVQIDVFDYATKNIEGKKAAHLEVNVEVTKDGQVVEEMTKTVNDGIIETAVSGLSFYEKISDDAEKGNYQMTIIAKDVLTNVKVEDRLEFVLE